MKSKSEMPARLPKFSAPPVVETVLSLQFDDLENYTDAHGGWFWKSFLSRVSGGWNRIVETNPIEQQKELFGDQVKWGAPQIRFQAAEPANRLQLSRDDDERMVQLQNNRLILNWKKGRSGKYPSYDALIDEFQQLFLLFSDFLKEAGFPPLRFNQWEVTYVNLIMQGELWKSEKDLGLIFKEWRLPRVPDTVASAESMTSTIRYLIGNNMGRLHCSMHRAKMPSEDNEALRLQFIARGPLDPNENNFRKGFDLGHETIVQAFAELTTESAHKIWQRTQ